MVTCRTVQEWAFGTITCRGAQSYRREYRNLALLWPLNNAEWRKAPIRSTMEHPFLYLKQLSSYGMMGTIAWYWSMSDADYILNRLEQ